MLGKREILEIAIAGVIVAVLGVGVTLLMLLSNPQRYRAETQVALIPSRQAPAVELSSLWEALSRGQAGRIGAEVMGQRRWLAPAALASNVPADSLSLTAGAVTDTTLIDVSVEAPTAPAAEVAADAVVREARPVVEQISGPFAIEVVQSAEGSATPVGANRVQAIVTAGAAGLLLGCAGALLVVRRRHRRALARPSATAAARAAEVRTWEPSAWAPAEAGPNGVGAETEWLTVNPTSVAGEQDHHASPVRNESAQSFAETDSSADAAATPVEQVVNVNGSTRGNA